MDITQTIEKHGLDFFNELLDIALISNFKNVNWLEFAYRHKLCKKTTKMIRENCFTATEEWYFLNGKYGKNEPRKYYDFRLRNGRGDWLLNVRFTQEQLDEFINQPNPTHV